MVDGLFGCLVRDGSFCFMSRSSGTQLGFSEFRFWVRERWEMFLVFMFLLFKCRYF
jgi:hypothetical protein